MTFRRLASERNVPQPGSNLTKCRRINTGPARGFCQPDKTGQDHGASLAAECQGSSACVQNRCVSLSVFHNRYPAEVKTGFCRTVSCGLHRTGVSAQITPRAAQSRRRTRSGGRIRPPPTPPVRRPARRVFQLHCGVSPPCRCGRRITAGLLPNCPRTGRNRVVCPPQGPAARGSARRAPAQIQRYPAKKNRPAYAKSRQYGRTARAPAGGTGPGPAKLLCRAGLHGS